MRIQQLNKIKTMQKNAEAYRRQLYTDSRWRDFEEYWMARYPGISDNILPVPVLVSDAQRQEASLINDVRVEITSDNAPEMIPAARILSAKINHMIRITNLITEIQDAVQDAQTCGTGCLMDGFGSQFGISADTIMHGFDTSRTNQKNERIEYNPNIYDDKPWSMRVHPANILVPYGSVRMSDVQGFFHIYARPLGDVHDDEKLIKKHRTQVKADTSVAMIRKNETSGDSMGEMDMVTLISWRDLKTGNMTTYNPTYPYALSDEIDEIMLRIDRLSIHPIIFNRNSRYWWGTADFDLLEPLAQEINDIRTMQMRHRRIQLIKILLNVSALEDEEDLESVEKAIEDLTSDEAGAIVKMRLGDKSVGDILHDFKPTQPYDMGPQLDIAKDEIKNFGMGIGPNQRGQMEGGRHTKYEAQKANAGFDQSLSPRRRVIREAILGVVQNWSKLIFDFATEPEIIKTYDAGGRPVLVEFTGADLRADYHYSISLESMSYKSQEERREEANMLLSQLMPFAQNGIVNPESLVRQYLLHAVSGDWDIESLMVNQQQPPGPPIPFEQYQQQFMRQQPSGPPSLAAMMSGQGGPPQGGPPQGRPQQGPPPTMQGGPPR